MHELDHDHRTQVVERFCIILLFTSYTHPSSMPIRKEWSLQIDFISFKKLFQIYFWCNNTNTLEVYYWKWCSALASFILIYIFAFLNNMGKAIHRIWWYLSGDTHTHAVVSCHHQYFIPFKKEKKKRSKCFHQI